MLIISVFIIFMDVLRKRGPENLIFRLSLRLFFRIFVLPKKRKPVQKDNY